MFVHVRCLVHPQRVTRFVAAHTSWQDVAREIGAVLTGAVELAVHPSLAVSTAGAVEVVVAFAVRVAVMQRVLAVNTRFERRLVPRRMGIRIRLLAGDLA